MKSSVISTPVQVWWGDASTVSPLCPRLDKWFSYDVMEQRIVPRQNHLVTVIPDHWFVSIT